MDPVEGWLWCGVMVTSNQTTLWDGTNILWNNTEIRGADIKYLGQAQEMFLLNSCLQKRLEVQEGQHIPVAIDLEANTSGYPSACCFQSYCTSVNLNLMVSQPPGADKQPGCKSLRTTTIPPSLFLLTSWENLLTTLISISAVMWVMI